MAVKLNHTIVKSHDKEESARFLAEILGLPAPTLLGPFAIVRISEDTSLDYMDSEDGVPQVHYAFLVTELEFDQIFGRIRELHLPYWADPHSEERGHINEWDDGRGVYFDDPSGHLLEIITRPYGSGGVSTTRRHPLFSRVPFAELTEGKKP